jgi:hypothetical protein
MRMMVPRALTKSRVQGGEELDGLVAGEEALVAVGVDGELGDDVAEDLEAVGAVDEIAAVVGVRRRQAHAQLDCQSFHRPLPARSLWPTDDTGSQHAGPTPPPASIPQTGDPIIGVKARPDRRCRVVTEL